MSDGAPIDYERLCRRLLGAGQRGVALEGANRHVYVQVAEIDCSLHDVLGRLELPVHFGNVTEALDAIDAALAHVGHSSLEETYQGVKWTLPIE